MIAIIDYNAGNLTSVARAVSHIGFQCLVTSETGKILKAERIIFPGVGAAGSAMASLKRTGLGSAIVDAFRMGTPILGICLGTQVIMGHSEENDTPCLGIMDGLVRAFQSDKAIENGSRLKIPHMGWNSIVIKKEHPVLSGIDSDDEFYFVHGFYPTRRTQSKCLGQLITGFLLHLLSVLKTYLPLNFTLRKAEGRG